MRVLWFSVTPSLFDEKKYGGWIASLEKIFRKYDNNIDLGIAFEYPLSDFKFEKDKVIYYPINTPNRVIDKLYEKVNSKYYWEEIKPKMLNIISDFKPDIIQCFGSEWPFGLITEYIDIPVVIHMQGFSNVYNESSELVYSDWEYIRCNCFNPKVAFTTLTNKLKIKNNLLRERHIMKINKYFLGRTDWDRMIVSNYSDGKYYHCSEALREDIYFGRKWQLSQENKCNIVTITQAGTLKGNEIILRTAKILKEQFNFNFIWNVAGDKDSFKIAERKTGIKHNENNINLLGVIGSKDVAKYLASSSMYVHPAIIDNSPNSLCEAQIIGCPVIAANVGGISSLVDDNETGILYPYNEPHTLAFKIMKLYDDKNHLIEISNNEKEVALERHNQKDILDNIINIYCDILSIERNKLYDF